MFILQELLDDLIWWIGDKLNWIREDYIYALPYRFYNFRRKIKEGTR